MLVKQDLLDSLFLRFDKFLRENGFEARVGHYGRILQKSNGSQFDKLPKYSKAKQLYRFDKMLRLFLFLFVAILVK